MKKLGDLGAPLPAGAASAPIIGQPKLNITLLPHDQVAEVQLGDDGQARAFFGKRDGEWATLERGRDCQGFAVLARGQVGWIPVSGAIVRVRIRDVADLAFLGHTRGDGSTCPVPRGMGGVYGLCPLFPNMPFRVEVVQPDFPGATLRVIMHGVDVRENQG